MDISPKILHICNDFSGSIVHKSLYAELDELGCTQTIFVPLRSEEKKSNNVFKFKKKGSRVVYSSVLSTFHRVFFSSKICRLVRDLDTTINIDDFDIVHATTLFSDGAVALKLFYSHQKPFIVAVRNTDVYTFLRYRPDLYWLVHDILNKAKKIVFVSDSLKKSFFAHSLIKGKRQEYEAKSSVVYNGIDDFWLDNVSGMKPLTERLLFIGRFDKNKNVDRLISAVQRVKKDFPDLTLTLVGGGGDFHDKLIAQIKGKSWIEFLGPIYSKVELKRIFKDHSIFTMVSVHETFGLVYIEALTQGLPVLLSKGQGIDGLFAQKFGEAVDPLSVKDIEKGIRKIIGDYGSYNLEDIDFSYFSWKNISKIYSKLYENVLALENHNVC